MEQTKQLTSKREGRPEPEQ